MNTWVHKAAEIIADYQALVVISCFSILIVYITFENDIYQCCLFLTNLHLNFTHFVTKDIPLEIKLTL